MQLRNLTRHPARLAVMASVDGAPSWLVIVKRTVRLSSGRWDASMAVEPPLEAPRLSPRGELLVPEDVVPVHPGTDVIVHGGIEPTPGERERHVEVEVGPLGCSLVVSGRRVWEGRGSALRPSRPEPLEPIERLGFEHARGGPDDPWNPIGSGAEASSGAPLPVVEDAGSRITGPDDRPPPASLGAVAHAWEPRRGFAGTYDEAWIATRAPTAAADLDPRFFLAGAGRFGSGVRLSGGEDVRIRGLGDGRAIASRIPRTALRVDVGGRSLVPELDTVRIEVGEDRMVLTYATRSPLDLRRLGGMPLVVLREKTDPLRPEPTA